MTSKDRDQQTEKRPGNRADFSSCRQGVMRNVAAVRAAGSEGERTGKGVTPIVYQTQEMRNLGRGATKICRQREWDEA